MITKNSLIRLASLLLVFTLTAYELPARYFKMPSNFKFRAEIGLAGTGINSFGRYGQTAYGLRASGQVLYKFKRTDFGILSGITYQRGGENQASYWRAKGQGDIPLHLLQMPLHLSYTFNIDRYNKLYIEAGPHLFYGLSGSINNINDTGKDYDVFEKVNGVTAFNRLGLGFGASLSYAYRDFYLRLGYDGTITDVVSKNASADILDRKGTIARHSALYFTVGYQF